MAHGFKAFNEFGTTQIDQDTENMVVVWKMVAVAGVNNVIGNGVYTPGYQEKYLNGMKNFQIWAKPRFNRNCKTFCYIQRGDQVVNSGSPDDAPGPNNYAKRPGHIAFTLWAGTIKAGDSPYNTYLDTDELFYSGNDNNALGFQGWDMDDDGNTPTALDPFNHLTDNWLDGYQLSKYNSTGISSNYKPASPWQINRHADREFADVTFDVVIVAEPKYLEKSRGDNPPYWPRTIDAQYYLGGRTLHGCPYYDYFNRQSTTGRDDPSPTNENTSHFINPYVPATNFRQGLGVNVFKSNSEIAFSSHFQYMEVFNGIRCNFTQEGLGGRYYRTVWPDPPFLPIHNYSLPKDTYALMNPTGPMRIAANTRTYYHGPCYDFQYGGTDVQIDIDFIMQQDRHPKALPPHLFPQQQFFWRTAGDQPRTFMFGRLLA